MSAPFRDDAAWRAQRAAELLADEKELQATLAQAEERIHRARLARRAPLFAKLRSPTGIADGSVLVVTLRTGGREATYEEKWPPHRKSLCNGPDTLDGVAKTAMDLARVREELFDRLGQP